MILNGLPERADAGPGEAADECVVDVGEPGVREVVAQVGEVGPGPVGADGLSGRRGVGKGVVAGCYPQPVEHPPVPGGVVEAGGVALVAEDGDLVQQGVELQQRVPVGAGVAANSGVAVTRSGLTCSLASAPSEYSATSAPSSWVASRWNSNMSNRSRPSPTWPRSLPGEAKARRVMPCRAASSTSSAAYARTCCSVAGGRCSGSASGWLAPPALPAAVRGRNIIRSRPVLALGLGLVAGLGARLAETSKRNGLRAAPLFPVCSRQVW